MIKILIMDDNHEKISRIRQILTSKCLVSSDDIDEAHSLNSGRLKLSRNHYDLLLLDLIMPIEDNVEIEPGKSENFINELHKFGRLKRPAYVIGLSQYETEVEIHANKYNDKLWKLIHYNLSKSDWEEILQNTIDTIVTTKKDLISSMQSINKYDYGIICALSEEFEQMKAASKLDWKKINSHDIEIEFYSSEIRTEHGNTLKLIAARNSMPGMQAAAVITSCMFSLFDIKAVFMTGICAGFKKDINDNINFGDIFIAESEYDYGSGKLCEGENGISIKHDLRPIECNFDLKSKMLSFIEEKNAVDELSGTLRKVNLNSTNTIPQVHFSPGACGSYVVANKFFMDQLLNHNRKLRGLDMEGYGVYLASHLLGKKSLMIKSICDFADTNKGDSYHKTCSYSSAWFLFEFLKYTF